jgi:DNA ligase 1
MEVSMKFPKLYSKSSTGKILEWEIEVEKDGYRMIAGQRDGKKVTSEWSRCESKNVGRSNETSAEEQAVLEAQALYKKKIKSHGYWENIEDIDKITFIEPTLAKKLKDRKGKIDFAAGLIIQNKFNGIRCIATRDGLFSRKGEKFISVPHIYQSLQKFFEDNPDAVLDGELFNYEYRQKLNEIMKLCRKTVLVTNDDLKESENLVKYYVYDGYGFGDSGYDETKPYTLRKSFIDRELPKYFKYYGHVEDHPVNSEKELDEIYRSYIEDGQEGVIVRIPNSSYEHKRSSNLLKYKPTDDDEFEIMDLLEGTGNWSGAAKMAVLKFKDDTFRASVKGSYENAVKMLNNKKDWIGKTVTIFYNGFTGLGTPNYAQLDPSNCFKGDR